MKNMTQKHGEEEMKGKTLHAFCLMGLLALAALSAETSAEARNPKWWATDKAPTKPGIRIYHVGNSWTDQAHGMHSIAQARGYNSTWKHYMIPGASLGWHWTHIHKRPGIPQEMSENKWDVLTLQGGGRHALIYGAGLKEDIGFANLVWQGNPQCQIYLFEAYLWRPSKEGESYESRSLAVREEYEQGADDITQVHRDKKPCLIIPVGSVFAELDKKMKRGEVPGYGNALELVEDKSHLGDDGRYVECVTFFATIYREDPHDCITDNLHFWHHKINVKREFAEVVWNVVWDVVRKDPYTGVNPDGPRLLGKNDLGRISLGTEWTWRIPATGGSGNFAWSVSSGRLPDGLELNTNTGIISGTPTSKGTCQFEIAVKDRVSYRTEVDKRRYQIDCFMPEAPVIVTNELYPAVVGGDHWQKIEFDSCYGEPTFAVSRGQLPAGLSLDSRTGEISGTPADSGAAEMEITITDKKGRTDTRTLKFTVADRNTNGLTCELYCRNFFKADDYKKYRSLRDNVAYVEDFTMGLVDAPDEPFALRFLGDLKVEKSGTYKFFLATQLAGGIVSVNGRRLVEKDFTRKTAEVSAEVELQAGEWPLEIMFWKRGVSHNMALKWKVEWQGPGFERQPIPKSALLYRAANSAQTPRVED